MSKSRAEILAENFINETFENEIPLSAIPDDPNEALLLIKYLRLLYVAGMKAMLAEALTYCSSWDGGDSAGTHDANDLYEHLKKLMEINLKPVQGTEQEVGELWDSEDQE